VIRLLFVYIFVILHILYSREHGLLVVVVDGVRIKKFVEGFWILGI
jgi:hypothetical protein